METRLMLIHALSPLHAGTGQGVGVIDLPIAREKATQIPFLPGSTLKGVFRDACKDNALRIKMFGPDTGNAELHAGAVTFTDARLLLLPVRSLCGVFAWVTSPLVLKRLLRDANDVQELSSLPATIPIPENDEICHVSDVGSRLPMKVGEESKVVLEDLSLGFKTSAEVTAWATALNQFLALDDLPGRLCVVSDNLLSFLLETATEITARIRIDDDKKTVVQGQLWYEEALPTESVLISVIVAANVQTGPAEIFETLRQLSSQTLQFGGKATVGRGLCKTALV